jgi:signal peptidase II
MMAFKNSSRLLPGAVAALVIGGDRAAKLAIRHSLAVYDNISIIPGWLRIVHTENPGAAFGILAEGNALLRSIVLIGISSLVLVFVASALWKQSGSMTARIGLSFILGGACGNLYDRLVHHTVTDFIEVYRGSWSFPAFNVADSAITAGAALLIIDLLKTHRVQPPSPDPSAPKHVSQAH